MISKKIAGWSSHALVVCYTLFFVFSSFGIDDTRFGYRMKESELEAYESGVPMSLVPERLAKAPESLRLALRVEAWNFPTEELTKTEAWSRLQSTVSEYARRLDFVEEQKRLWEQRHQKRGLWFSCLSLVCILAILVFLVLAISDRKYRTIDSKKVNWRGAVRSS